MLFYCFVISALKALPTLSAWLGAQPWPKNGWGDIKS
jgi:hypothetical protein